MTGGCCSSVLPGPRSPRPRPVSAVSRGGSTVQPCSGSPPASLCGLSASLIKYTVALAGVDAGQLLKAWPGRRGVQLGPADRDP